MNRPDQRNSINKKYSLILCVILLGTHCHALAQSQASYSIIKVNGKVISKLLKREVKAGDVVNLSDKLIFESRESYIHVINAEGSKSIGHVPDNSPREFMQLMQTYLSPDRNNKATRGGANSRFDNIKSELTADTILVLGNGAITMDTTEISMHKPAGVKVKYVTNDQKVSHLISTETGFNLGKEQLLLNNPGITSYPKVTVVYYEDVGDPIFKSSVLLGSFTPFYLNETELQKEVKIIIKTLKGSKLPNDLIVKEITHYLTAEYATPIQENVKAWIDENKLLN